MATYAAWGYLYAATSSSFQSCTANARAWLGRMLPLAACCNLVENTLHRSIIHAPALPLDAVPYAVAGVSVSLKWLLLLGFVCAVGVLRRRARRAARLGDR